MIRSALIGPRFARNCAPHAAENRITPGCELLAGRSHRRVTAICPPLTKFGVSPSWGRRDLPQLLPVLAAVFGGSSLQVSGPTGAMAVVLLPIVAVTVQSRWQLWPYGWWVDYSGGAVGLRTLVRHPLAGGGRVYAGHRRVILLQQFPLALGTAKPDSDNVALLAVKTLAATDWRAATPSLILTLGTCA